MNTLAAAENHGLEGGTGTTDYLELKGLRKSYNGVPAVRDFSLSVKEGAFVSVLGPSGCGKTTTLRMLAGFVEPDDGTIVLNGDILFSRSRSVPPERRRMGMVFQNYALWPHMTIQQNVRFGLDRLKVERADADRRVREILELVGLGHAISRYPQELSGGQQQRIALARALVTRPDILLLDEPLSNLDSKLREQLRDELRALQTRTGITFVYVTHDQTEALTLSDVMVVMRDGNIAQIGSPRDVYDRPANAFVADFMGAANLVPCVVLTPTGKVRLDDSDLEFEGDPGANAFVPGARAMLMIRPDAVLLEPVEPGQGDHVLVGTVTASTFQGSTLDYRIDAGGTKVRVIANRGRQFAVGDGVRIGLPASQCVILPAEERARISN